ncbi:MAG TPA: hypothetical protein VEB20_20545, partial [Azospirillaceae bacterium]|nr:hypothetical protein [Azospirillaceae bacterium]
DTVVDTTERSLEDGTATGFVFGDVSPTGMLRTIERATALWNRRDLWRRVQRAAMARDFGWERSAVRYLELYASLAGAPAEAEPALQA